MAKMTKLEKQIDNFAQNIVNEMFKTFQEQKSQGPEFTWEKFPDIVKRLALAYTPMTFFKISGKKLEAVEAQVGPLVLKLAQEKVQSEIYKTEPPATNSASPAT